MDYFYRDWVAAAKAAGHGGITLPAITRGLPYSRTINFGADYSADAFAASLRLTPDAAGATLADFTVVVGSYSGGVTPVTITLSQTVTAALPADGDADGLAWLVFDMLRTPSGGTQDRFVAGVAAVSGGVTSYGS